MKFALIAKFQRKTILLSWKFQTCLRGITKMVIIGKSSACDGETNNLKFKY